MAGIEATDVGGFRAIKRLGDQSGELGSCEAHSLSQAAERAVEKASWDRTCRIADRQMWQVRRGTSRVLPPLWDSGYLVPVVRVSWGCSVCLW